MLCGFLDHTSHAVFPVQQGEPCLQNKKIQVIIMIIMMIYIKPGPSSFIKADHQLDICSGIIIIHVAIIM